MKILIAYDGTINSKAALRYGLGRLKEEGGRALVLSLFHSAMFVDYEGGFKAEEMARAETAKRLAEARAIITESGAGLWVRFEETDGEPDAEIVGKAEEFGPDVILAPAKYNSLTGRVACPIIAFPGCILVPVDSTGHADAALGRIIAEAKATLSRVALVGIVPVHMYGASEKDEVAALEKDTLASVKALGKALKKEGVEVLEAMRPGYPDEEILRAMEDFKASILMVPTVEDSPSELGKAANMITEEETLKRHVMIVHKAV